MNLHRLKHSISRRIGLSSSKKTAEYSTTAAEKEQVAVISDPREKMMALLKFFMVHLT